MKMIIILILFITFVTFGQKKEPIKKYSFTLQETYEKEVKNYPFIEPVLPILPDDVNAMRNIKYVKYGDRNLELDIFFKKLGDINRPVIILIHGGGWRSGDRTLTYPMALELADLGYTTISIEYRLTTEALFPAAIIDVNNAINWVKTNSQRYNIDTSQIVLLGCSAGGQIASLTGFAKEENKFYDSSQNFNNVKAIVNIDGLMDFLGEGSEEFDELPDNKKPRAAHQWLGYSQIERPDLWRKASGINYINEDSPPILFINSSRPRFHAGRDEAIEILKLYNIYYEVHTIENTPHTFWLFHPWFKQTVKLVNNFIVKVFPKEN